MNPEVLKLERVIEILSDVVEKEGLLEPVFEVSSGSSKGDGFTSFMTRVIVKGSNKTLPLIIKSAPAQMVMVDRIALRNAFLQEINYYEKIFPAFRKFQDEIGVEKPFNAAPICYKTIDADKSEMLVLENIKEKGFKVFNKKQRMNQAHIEFVLKYYGHLHAVSFAMKKRDPESFDKLRRALIAPFSEESMSAQAIQMFAAGVDKIGKCFNEEGESDVREYICGFKDSVGTFFNEISHYEGGYSVLVHGDCWCNNMMFKYEDGTSTNPSDMRMFDFQIGYPTSPVIDLSYFIYISASEEMLENLDHFLKIYHASLSAHLSEMGCDVEELYPFSALKKEWQLYARYGLIFAACVFRVMLREDEEIMEFSDEITVTDAFMNSSKNDHLINEMYRIVGKHFYKNKLL